jgi:hypothetical protein
MAAFIIQFEKYYQNLIKKFFVNLCAGKHRVEHNILPLFKYTFKCTDSQRLILRRLANDDRERTSSKAATDYYVFFSSTCLKLFYKYHETLSQGGQDLTHYRTRFIATFNESL